MDNFKFFRCAAGDDANAVLTFLNDCECGCEIVESVSDDKDAVIAVDSITWFGLESIDILDGCGVETIEVIPTQFADVE